MKCFIIFNHLHHCSLYRRPNNLRDSAVMPVSTAERGTDACLAFSVSEKRKSEKPEPQTGCRFWTPPTHHALSLT